MQIEECVVVVIGSNQDAALHLVASFLKEKGRVPVFLVSAHDDEAKRLFEAADARRLHVFEGRRRRGMPQVFITDGRGFEPLRAGCEPSIPDLEQMWTAVHIRREENVA